MTREGFEHRLDTPLGEICWFEWNKAEEGPVLLLLHATGFHGRLWDRIIGFLPDDTHVIAPDQLGHGRSFKPETMANWTESGSALLPLVDAFQGRPIIGVGHSMGGFVLTRLAADRPDAFQHILLIDPVILEPAYYREPSGARPDAADHPVSRRRNAWESPQQMQEHFAARAPYNKWDAGVLADYCRHGLLPRADGDGFELACPPRLEANIYQNSQGTSPYSWADDIRADVTILRAPTRERQGMMDFSNSPTWVGAAEAFHAKSDILWPDNSHFIPMEDPQRTADLITEIMAES